MLSLLLGLQRLAEEAGEARHVLVPGTVLQPGGTDPGHHGGKLLHSGKSYLKIWLKKYFSQKKV